jgi:soluble cytochrome b562
MDNDELKSDLEGIRNKCDNLSERVAKVETQIEDTRDDVRDIIGGITLLVDKIDNSNKVHWANKGALTAIIPISVALIAVAVSMFSLLVR